MTTRSRGTGQLGGGVAQNARLIIISERSLLRQSGRILIQQARVVNTGLHTFRCAGVLLAKNETLTYCITAGRHMVHATAMFV